MRYPDYEDLLESFEEHGVRYLVGGAHALAFHARPRATKDLDVFLDPALPNARRAVRALTAFFGGTPPKYVTIASLRDPDTIIQLGVAPVRVDLLSSFGAIRRFADAWKRRAEGRFGRVRVHYLSLADLVREKTYWDRPQDRADLVTLERSRTRASKRPRRRPRRR